MQWPVWFLSTQHAILDIVSLIQSSLYNNPSYSCILIGSRL